MSPVFWRLRKVQFVSNLVRAVPVADEERGRLDPHVAGRGGVQDEGDVVEVVVLGAAGATRTLGQQRLLPLVGTRSIWLVKTCKNLHLILIVMKCTERDIVTTERLLHPCLHTRPPPTSPSAGPCRSNTTASPRTTANRRI